jgi:hypothetical protein
MKGSPMNAADRLLAVENMMGPEPILKTGAKDGELADAYNWYTYFNDGSERVKYLIEYLERKGLVEEVAAIKAIEPWILPSYVYWQARMMTNGFVLDPARKIKFEALLKGAIEKGKAIIAANVKKADETVVLSVQDYIKRQTRKAIGDLELLVDRRPVVSETDEINKIFVRYNLKTAQCEAIIAWASPVLAELEMSKSDAELKEAYKGVPVGPLMKFYAMVIDIARTVGKIKAKTAGKRGRKPKVKSPGYLVKRVKFKKADKKLKIESIDPVNIIGATQLWVFNIKYRKLGVYVAEAGKTLSVKGTSVLNYDEKQSVAKKLRKPEKPLKEVKEAGKVTLRHFLEGVRAKPSLMRSRLNEDTILVRAVK